MSTTALLQEEEVKTLDPNTAAAVKEACGRIAPTWPLDQSVAINPWWQLIDQPIAQRAAQLAANGNVKPLPSRSYFRQQWDSGRIGELHLQTAIDEAGSKDSVDKLVGGLEREVESSAMLLMADVLDGRRDLDRQVAWHDEVVHQISQFCAAYFDQGQAIWHLDTSGSLYESWLRTVAHERGIGIIMGERDITARFAALPQTATAVIAEAGAALGIREGDLPAYFHALLMSVNGWASWCSWQRWQAQLRGKEDDVIVELLAIRLAWELILFDGGQDPAVAHEWRQATSTWPKLTEAHATSRQSDWIWLRAMELAYQNDLLGKLSKAAGPPPAPARPQLQAAFCIDVRSEAWRRALESVTEGIETIGCAGFFGLPVAYKGLGDGTERAQLPGLLAPSHLIGETLANDQETKLVVQRLETRRNLLQRWQQAQASGPASFAYVESFGLLYGLKFLKQMLPGGKAPAKPAKPVLCDGHGEVSVADKAAIAGGMAHILLQSGELAPVVLLVGHESESCNNPHASALNCGACGGQSGEVNARMLAELLNDAEVRELLAASGLTIPADTCFIAGVHNTTTDEVRLCDSPEQVAASELTKIQGWLARAGDLARAERAERHGEKQRSPEALLKQRRQVAGDWAQVRPEWGLAGNAAFIVGPRWLTRDVNLDGRVFLHDYEWRKDPDSGVLQQLFGGPLVVTHWINMQYYASTVDNLRYGSGNKVLHNVVGGNLGVFEGNGGDLRIGLSMQSLNDGNRWVHEPLRLSAVVAAPQAAIQALIEANQTLKQLIDNDWIYMFQIDEESGVLARLYQNEWSTWSGSSGDD